MINLAQIIFTLLFEGAGILFLIYICGVMLVRKYIKESLKDGYIENKGQVYKIVPADVVAKK